MALNSVNPWRGGQEKSVFIDRRVVVPVDRAFRCLGTLLELTELADAGWVELLRGINPDTSGRWIGKFLETGVRSGITNVKTGREGIDLLCGEAPMQGKDSPDSKDASLVVLRGMTILLVYFAFGLRGFRTEFVKETHVADVLLGFMVASAATLFCAIDARTLGKMLASYYYFYMFITWPLAVPIYFIWSRGGKGIWLAFGHAIGLITTVLVGNSVAKLMR